MPTLEILINKRIYDIFKVCKQTALHYLQRLSAMQQDMLHILQHYKKDSRF